jgi:hypothetical protein
VQSEAGGAFLGSPRASRDFFARQWIYSWDLTSVLHSNSNNCSHGRWWLCCCDGGVRESILGDAAHSVRGSCFRNAPLLRATRKAADRTATSGALPSALDDQRQPRQMLHASLEQRHDAAASRLDDTVHSSVDSEIIKRRNSVTQDSRRSSSATRA